MNGAEPVTNLQRANPQWANLVFQNSGMRTLRHGLSGALKLDGMPVFHLDPPLSPLPALKLSTGL